MNFDVLFTWVGAIASVLAIAATVTGLFRFFTVRLIQARKEEFRRYHHVVRQLNVDGLEGKAPYIDMQVAAVFELTLMKKYYPVSLRILRNRLKRMREDGTQEKYAILFEEIVRSMEAIESRACTLTAY